MTNWIISHSAIEPALLDQTSSATTVYERRNVKKQNLIDMSGESYVQYEYEERTFTKDEFQLYLNGQLNTRVGTLETFMDDMATAIQGGVDSI